MTDLVRFDRVGDVARLHFDDGKANVISPASLAALNAALDRAEKEAGAVALFGRSGRFCAGFDEPLACAQLSAARCCHVPCPNDPATLTGQRFEDGA